MATRASLPLSSCNAWLTLCASIQVAWHQALHARDTHGTLCPLTLTQTYRQDRKYHQTFCAEALVSLCLIKFHNPLLRRYFIQYKRKSYWKWKNKRFYILPQITITAEMLSHGCETSPPVSPLRLLWTVGRLMLLRWWIVNVCLISDGSVGLPASQHTMLWSLATHVCWPVSTTSKQRVKNTKPRGVDHPVLPLVFSSSSNNPS